ncbi:MAG: 50S ribosomal protein L13 [Patescibacteria group bacterium]
MKEIYTIDASGRSLGRVATEAAVCLLGKKTPDFKKNIVKNLRVTIVNAGKLKITTKKRTEKYYKTYSGYPGGLKKRSMAHVIDNNGIKAVLEHAIRGMLPKNRLHALRMKNLVVEQ